MRVLPLVHRVVPVPAVNAGAADSAAPKEVAAMPNDCIVVSLDREASRIKASDGREIPFTRAVLKLANDCGAEAVELVPHATLGQEGGTVQDVSSAFAGSVPSIPAGGAMRWDVYDLLLPAHPGTASKVHMFGYRAALNWRFELAAWAEYRVPPAAEPARTPAARWILQWTVPDPATGAVELSIEEGKS